MGLIIGNVKSLIKVYRHLKFILTERQKKKSLFVFASMLLVSLLELLGVSSIYPLLQMMLSPEKFKRKWYISWIVSLKPNITNSQIILIIGIAIILVFLVKNATAIICAYVQNSFAANFKRETSVLMLESYMKRPYEYFIRTNSSIIIRGINSDSTSVYNILLNLFQIVGECISIVLIGLFLIKIDWITALFALSLATVCFIAITLGFKKKIKKAGLINREANAETYQSSYQAITGIKEITVLDRRKQFVEQFNKFSKKLAESTVVFGVINVCPDRILEGICIGGFLGVICIRVAMGVEIDSFVPILGSFAMGAFKILPSISKVSSRLNQIIYYMPGLESCYENIGEARKLDIQGKNQYERFICDKEPKEIKFSDSISIEGVQWKYQNSENIVLNSLSMKIIKGESVAFIGASGAGKTTLADILLGLLKPQLGTVKMDNIDIFAIPHEWSHIIGYVPQTVFLIDDTIRANVAFGLSREIVSDEKIWQALEQAQLKNFVENLPNGLDTIVGERGVKFSGGQRQRIAIARALYEDPDILVLDEATSALDTETENAVMESIDALHGHKTLIIVAHRLTTIRNCDKIYEIVGGKAVERRKEAVFKSE